MTHNPHAKASHNYGVVDDLEQSPATMSTLEVVQTCPYQKKALLNTLGAIDPLDYHLMTFDLDQSTPKFPSSVALQIPFIIKNICIYHYVIEKDTLICMMSTKIWND